LVLVAEQQQKWQRQWQPSKSLKIY